MKILLSLFLLFGLQLHAQKLLLDVLPLINSKVVYKNVLEVSGKSKMELQKKSLLWFDNMHILLTENKSLDETHEFISGEHSFKTLWGPNDFPELYKKIEYKISLTLKNERYQYEISSFMVMEPSQATQLEIFKTDHKRLHKYNKAFYKRIDAEIRDLMTSLEKAMAQ